MNKTWITLAVVGVLTACSEKPVEKETVAEAEETLSLNTDATPPVAKKVPHELTAHGDTRVDNYYWMRDDERKDPEIIAHLEKENAYTDTVLAPLEQDRETLFNELVARVPKNDATVPYLKNDYWYHLEYEGEKEYPIFLRKPDGEGEESVLLDVNALAEGHDYYRVGQLSVSSNNKLLAYSEDTVSRRVYTILVKNLETGELLEDRLEDTSGEVQWANDNTHLYYIKKDLQTLLGYQVYRHKLGTDQSEDVLIFEETDPTFYTGMSKSKDGEVIFIHHSNTEKKGVTLIDANSAEATAEPFLPIQEGLEYHIAKLGETYYILTNHEAKNFRIMKVNADNTADISAWEEVVAHDPEVFLSGMEVMQGYLVTNQKKNGIPSMMVRNLETGKASPIPMADPIYNVGFSNNTQVEADSVRIRYASLTTPPSVIDVNLATLEKETLKQEQVSDDFDAANYASERLMVPANDGKEVPVSLVYRKDSFKKDGTNPLYQYAYGSYGHTIDPSFARNWLTLVDRGFVVAIAHIRGSQMLGREWYEDGKMGNKINSFTDFIDVTEYLTESGYADASRVYAMGGSAGGLLMGAVANMSPDNYDAIIAHVPFVDVVTTMSDASIPLTTGEYTEWGNPANADEYAYMLSYSPYDQVKAQDYPHMLITTGLHDSQVQYFEPMKWVAKLRDMKTDDNLLLFDVNMESGHGGASGRFERLKRSALEYAFIFELAGVEL